MKEMPDKARALYAKDRAEYLHFYSTLENELERETAIRALNDSFWQSPEMFAELIDQLEKDAMRNTLIEVLLESIGEHQGPEEAAQFIIERNRVGRRRMDEMRIVCHMWFQTDPERVIVYGSKLELPEDEEGYVWALARYRKSVEENLPQ